MEKFPIQPTYGLVGKDEILEPKTLMGKKYSTLQEKYEKLQKERSALKQNLEKLQKDKFVNSVSQETKTQLGKIAETTSVILEVYDQFESEPKRNNLSKFEPSENL
jgi:cell division protein FtsB